MSEKIISIRDLKVSFYTDGGIIKAVDGLCLDINKGEIFGLAGESGCGKTVSALSILRLIPLPGEIVSGECLFDGLNLINISEEEIREIRGRKISMIFQEPMTSLNPLFTIGDQIAEAIILHQGLNKQNALEKTAKLLTSVGIPDSSRTMRNYPFELSGGMRQRVMIAMAISCNPLLLIADEPTTLLDVTIQAQIIKLISDRRNETELSVLWISHNLGIIAEICDRVAIMYAGSLVECAKVDVIFNKPEHPYTRGLIESVPKLDEVVDVFQTIPGTVPDMINLPSGCSFHPRCSLAIKVCYEQRPPFIEIKKGHFVACFLVNKES